MPYQFTNNASTTLAAGITNVATTLTVSTGTGALFPTPSGASVFELTLISQTSSTIEIVKCTARTTDTFTITRAQEGTTAAAFTIGDRVELRVTAAVLNNFAQADGTLAVSGGGTGVQTLTGIVKGNGTSAFSAATAGTDYLAPPSGTALLKANSGGALANATAGTDYLAPPSGTAILKANSGGALANATAGTDYSAGTSALATGILKSTTSTGALSIATAGTDYLAPPSGTAILKANSGGALANATAGTDYSAGTSALATGILKSTTATGALSIAASGTDYQAPIGTISGITKGNGANALTAATGTDVTTLIGTNAVTNATNLNGSGTISDTTTVAATGDKVGYRSVPLLNQAPATAITTADAGKSFYANAAGTFTIPANASQAFPVGSVLTFINMNAGACTIAITTDTMYLAGTGTTGSRTLAQYGMATAIKMTSTTWLISGSGLT
jgi:hypothetical protein